jgi:hypothetical protein
VARGKFWSAEALRIQQRIRETLHENRCCLDHAAIGVANGENAIIADRSSRWARRPCSGLIAYHPRVGRWRLGTAQLHFDHA